jgi:hypothetical protein
MFTIFVCLQETEKGKFYKTDDYVAHAVVTKDQKNVFLVTNKYVSYCFVIVLFSCTHFISLENLKVLLFNTLNILNLLQGLGELQFLDSQQYIALCTKRLALLYTGGKGYSLSVTTYKS